MTLVSLSVRRSVGLLIATTAEKIGFSSATPYTDVSLMLADLSIRQTTFLVLTTDYLSATDVLAQVRPYTHQLCLCILPEHRTAVGCPFTLLDRLQLDALCLWDELSDCLKIHLTGCHYRSSLLTIAYKVSKTKMLPGWDRISPAEKDVLRLMLSGLKVPAIADKLCRSPYTVQSQKVSMGQKLGVPGGGPNSFVNFILANYLIIKELLNE